MFRPIALAVFLISAAANAEDAPLHLVCLGEGSANRVASTYAQAYDNQGNSAWGNAVAQRSVPFGDQVNIEISEGAGRIRMPRAMLPTLRGGSDGWFEIEKIKRSDAEITGVVQVNFINSPKLRLDRMTGRISISGKAGDYAGVCEPYDPAAVQRKF